MFIRLPAAWRRAIDPAQRNRALGAEVASIIFHASFFILLVGVIYGKAAGFVGNAAVVEGDSFTEARANYDNLSEGRLATEHAGFQVKVDSFSASYWASGSPRDFTSRVRIYDGGRIVESANIQVNHYVDYRGVKIYQAGYGWAPTLKIETPDPQRDESLEAQRREAFAFVNRNKRSLSLNLKAPEGQAIFRKLAAEADVIVEGFRPGVMKRLGADYETICALNRLAS